MGVVRYISVLAAVVVGGLVFSCGCAPEAKVPEAPAIVRPMGEVMDILRARVGGAGPMKGNGHCVLEYWAEGKKKKENIPVKWWLNPPLEVYMQGDVAFDPRGIVVGSNAREFWLSLRPKEISSYWWGRWADTNGDDMLMISPRVMLEAMGMVAVDGDMKLWALGWQGSYEILTRRSRDGVPVKRVSMQGEEAFVKKIEYFDVWGAPSVTAELDDYKEAVEGFFVPMSVRIVKHGREGKDSSADITIKSAKPAEISQKQRDFLFKAPEPKGFKHVYINVNGRWVEQE